MFAPHHRSEPLRLGGRVGLCLGLLVFSGCGLRVRLPSGESANEVAKMPWVPETESAVRGWVARHANPRDASVDLEGEVPYVETSLPESSSVRRVGYFFARKPWRVTAVVFWLPKQQAAPALGPPEGAWWGMPLFRTDTEGDLYAPDAHALVWVLDPAMRLPPQRRVDLPRDVPIKTRTRTFHRDLLFAVDGGKLWFKRNPAHGGTLGEAWRLFGTGLPTARPGVEPFVAPAPLVEVSADADDLLVVDERGRVYLCTTKSESMGSADGWEDGWGYPGKRPLFVDAQRQRTAALAIGRRAEHAQWFEDAIGNRHHFGPMGTTTLYALSHDGRRLAFTDNGLPNDFTRDLCPPDDGRFEAVAMSASASAILLIDRFGRVVTRFDDYDLNGGTPNFEYTYRSEVRADDAGDAFLTSLTPYYLPLSPWRWHAPPALSGAARLSRDVTVLQTGEGNAARELRVAGLNADGRTGYYAKGIEAEAWAFVASDEVLSDRSKVLDPADVAFGAAEFARTGGDLSLSVVPRGTGDRRRWSGALSSSAQDGPEAPMDGVRVSLDFSGLCSPAQLQVEVDGARFTVALHTVDLWTPMQRQHPGDDGSPQWWLGTLVLADEVLTDRRPAVRRVVEVLRRHHHDVFGLLVERVGDRLELVSLHHEVGEPGFLRWKLRADEAAEDTAQWPGGALWAQAQTLLDAPLHAPSSQVLQQGSALRAQLKAAVSSAAERRRAEVRAMQVYRRSIVLLSKPVRLGRVPRLPALLDVQAQRATRALEALEQRWLAVDAALAERLAAWADALSSPTARAPTAR